LKDRPFIHTLLYGESGAGKSTLAATFPTPQLVFMFDPYTKDFAYLKDGRASGVIPDDRIPWQEVFDPEEKLLRHIEYFLDEDPTQPKAYQLFLHRFTTLHKAIMQGHEPWATIIIDSLTMAELAARKLAEYKLNPTTKEPRQWFGYSTNALEEILMIRCGSLPRNVVVVCHLDKERDEVEGMMLRNPNLPGRLRGNVASAFGEFYRVYRQREDNGRIIHYVQTRGDRFFNASTMIDAPNPCTPHYEKLWTGWNQ
jgi:AAA domain